MTWPSQPGPALAAFRHQLLSLAERRLIFFGGKGGVGKTTVSALAALLIGRQRRVILFTTDPASNLRDLFPEAPAGIEIEQLDAERLYAQFLEQRLPQILELTDRGTLLDKDEARRFFELALPGVDELMAWLHLGALARENRDALLIVDTAPTGHTLRMLASSNHFAQFLEALGSMQAKHKDLIEQFTRRRVHDAIDDFLASFKKETAEIRALLSNEKECAFVPVTLSEPLVLSQSRALIEELRAGQLPIPFVILNRAATSCECAACTARQKDEAEVALASLAIVSLPDACRPLDSAATMEAFLDERPFPELQSDPNRKPASQRDLAIEGSVRMLFFAGKGGVGKSTTSSAIALWHALEYPEQRFVLISVDPAHTLPDLFSGIVQPPNLSVEIIDTRERWRRFRDGLGEEINKAIDAFTPKGISFSRDARVMQQLIEIAPPGADELFAIMRLSALGQDQSIQRVFVDTAPTGHFLRLIDLPASAGEWVHEFLRLLLNYRELIAPGTLAEELLQAARALRSFAALLSSKKSATLLVTRPERVVVAETTRLAAELERRSMTVAGTIVNYMTPESDCRCDARRRELEEALISAIPDAISIPRQTPPPRTLEDLRHLIPMRQTRDDA